ncbi:MAG: hypothetical protein U1F34_03975 [Gammaproteobacteria bacterium]
MADKSIFLTPPGTPRRRSGIRYSVGFLAMIAATTGALCHDHRDRSGTQHQLWALFHLRAISPNKGLNSAIDE